MHRRTFGTICIFLLVSGCTARCRGDNWGISTTGSCEEECKKDLDLCRENIKEKDPQKKNVADTACYNEYTKCIAACTK